MNPTVRPVRDNFDEQKLINFLDLNLPYRSHARFFQWLYHRNPDGHAMAWIAEEPETKRIVGAAAAFPRSVYFRGARGRAYLLGDFCADATHRSLGLALALQRACLEGVSAAQADFAIDLPSPSMVAVYSRLKIPVNETIVRYVMPLRLDRQIQKIVHAGVLASGIARVANAWLAVRSRRSRGIRDLKIRPEKAPWGAEFSEAADKWTGANAISVARTCEYLNWRYAEHPQRAYEMTTARRNGRLAGYLVSHLNGNTLVIDDLFAEDETVSAAVLREVVALSRAAGVHSISAPWPSTDPDSVNLRKCGFRPRESSPAVLLHFDDTPARRAGLPSANRHISHGDWET